MSKAVKAIPIIGRTADKVLGVVGLNAKGGPKDSPDGAQGQAAREAAQAKEADTREAMLKQQAAAGGAVRSENEADLLGYSPVAKRRTASRTLLG